VNWVYDVDALGNDHALAGPGVVGGKLVGAVDGLTFWPTAVEGAVRPGGWAGPFVVPAGALTATWSVPRGCRADGSRPRKPLGALVRQSRRRRLVVAAGQVSYVFDVRAATSRADDVAEAFGVARLPDL
jgi:hypothetical protein